jgi:hypothetical protein
LKKIYLNLSGGLGNQIFELFYCLSYYDTKKHEVQIVINTYYLDKYKTKRSFELAQILSLVDVHWELENKPVFFRLVKMLSKVFKKDISLKIGNIVFIDSYYQNFSTYTENQLGHLKQIITAIRNKIKSHPANNQVCLHYRLTDFKTTKSEFFEEIKYFQKNLNNRSFNAITDDEQDFLRLTKQHLHPQYILSFEDFSPWELLLEFAKYEVLISNGSTLSFFGALLGNCTEYKSRILLLEHNFKLIRSS